MSDYNTDINKDGISIGTIEKQDGEWLFVPDGQPVSYNEIIRIAQRIKQIEEAGNNE
jgi:hypothetical protein